MLRRVRVQARVRRRSIEDTVHAKSQGDPRVHTERPSVVHETLHNSSGPPIVFQLFGAQFVVQFPSSKEALKLRSWKHPNRRIHWNTSPDRGGMWMICRGRLTRNSQPK